MSTSMPSLRRVNVLYTLVQLTYWAAFAAFSGYQTALLLGRGFSSGDAGVFEIDGEKRVVTAGDTMLKMNGVTHGCVCLEAGVLLDIFTPMREDFVRE